MAKLIGVTGGIGSGKSTVLRFFSEFKNVSIYVADIEAKKIMNTSPQIVSMLKQEFSDKVYDNNGLLNRAFLAEIVFKNKNKLKKLNQIVHPFVHNHLQDFIKRNNESQYILYENAILFENKSDSLCDKIITVTAPITIRVKRVIKRDNTSSEEVLRRINNQWPDSKKIMLSNYIVHNYELDDTKEQVARIHHKLIN